MRLRWVGPRRAEVDDIETARAEWRRNRISQLNEKISQLEREMKRDDRWGAAVGARTEWLKELHREVRCLGLGMDPSPANAGLPPPSPYPQPGGRKIVTPGILAEIAKAIAPARAESTIPYNGKINEVANDPTFSILLKEKDDGLWDVYIQKHDRGGEAVGKSLLWSNLSHAESLDYGHRLAIFCQIPACVESR